MDINEIKSIIWENSGHVVPYGEFYSFAKKEGFEFIFNYPNDANPQIAIASRTIEHLKEKVEPVQGEDWKKFI